MIEATLQQCNIITTRHQLEKEISKRVMCVLVGDLLKENVFPDFQLIAGSDGLARRITMISVMDAPDMDRWIRGGEFLIGSAYIFRENPEMLTEFVRKVDAKGIAAVGIKLDRFLSSFPESLIQEAEASRLPLFQIPLRYSWPDIIEVVQSRLWSEKMRKTGYTTDIEIFPWDDNWDVRRLFSAMSKEFGKDIFVVAPALEINQHFRPESLPFASKTADDLLQSPPLREVDFPRRGSIGISLEERSRGNETVWLAAYRLRQEAEIDVFVLLDEGEHYPAIREERLILRAVNLLRVAMLESTLFSRQMNAKKERFLENLCLGTFSSEDIALERAKNLGLALQLPAIVFQVCTISRSALPSWKPPFIFSYPLADCWVCIESSARLEAERDAFRRIASEKDLWFALGSPFNNLLDTTKSYDESKRALTWMRKFRPRPGVYRYGELAFHSFLNRIVSIPEAEGVWDRFWRPLAEGDSKRRAVSLEEVAGALIRCDFNGKQCAKELHLHYNTLRNYLREIETLVGVSLSSRLHRMAFSLSYFVDVYKKQKSWESYF